MSVRFSVVAGSTGITVRQAAASALVFLLSIGVTVPGMAQWPLDSARYTSRVNPPRFRLDPARRLERGRRGETDISHRDLSKMGKGAYVSSSVGSPGFGDALVGSFIGTAVGGPLGMLMVRGAANDAAWTDAERQDGQNCCGLQRAGFAILGVAIAAGAGPYGAAKRLDARGGAVYAPAVSGQVLLGGLGYAVGTSLGGRSNRLLSGLALGIPLAALGSAAGAVFGARASSQMMARGAVRFERGAWDLGLPDVHLQPSIGAPQRPTVHITVLSATID